MAIALLTDFGLRDAYVASLKAVLLGLAPQTPVLDISHQIPAFDRIYGGLALFQAYRYFPEKTIFLTIVDPGVGSERKAILVESQKYFFLAPDNGILSFVLSEELPQRVFHLTNKKFFLQDTSPTFHGRDIFAPVAAHLSLGVDPATFGPQLKGFDFLNEFFPKKIAAGMEGKILAIDAFGNAITNFRSNQVLEIFPNQDFTLSFQEKTVPSIKEVKQCYAQGSQGQAMLLFNSSGLLEIAVPEGSAASLLGLKGGDPVLLSP